MDSAELREIWKNRSDEEVAQALTELDSFEPEARVIIVSEADRRRPVSEQLGPGRLYPSPVEAEPPVSEPLFLYIPITRLILFTLLTFGVYQFYWIYKNWRYAAERDHLKITPFWRGWFGIFWFRPILNRIRNDEIARRYATPNFSPQIAWLWVPLVILANNYGRSATSVESVTTVLSVYMFFILLQALCLVKPQLYINEVTKLRNPSARFYRWSPGHFACFIPLVAWTVIGFGEGVMEARKELMSDYSGGSLSSLLGEQKSEIKTLLERISLQRSEQEEAFKAKVAKIGFDQVLTPTFSATDKRIGMSESLRRCRQVIELCQQFHRQRLVAFDSMKSQVEALQLDESTKSGFIQSLPTAKAKQKRISDAEMAVVQHTERIVEYLRDNRRHWTVENDTFVFNDDSRLDAFNKLVAKLDGLNATETQAMDEMLKSRSHAEETIQGLGQ